MAWQKIDDKNVRHVWEKAADDRCPESDQEVAVSPDYYAEAGIPICGCGRDMVYGHTEINVED